jgi:hypothetical protein
MRRQETALYRFAHKPWPRLPCVGNWSLKLAARCLLRPQDRIALVQNKILLVLCPDCEQDAYLYPPSHARIDFAENDLNGNIANMKWRRFQSFGTQKYLNTILL